MTIPTFLAPYILTVTINGINVSTMLDATPTILPIHEIQDSLNTIIQLGELLTIQQIPPIVINILFNSNNHLLFIHKVLKVPQFLLKYLTHKNITHMNQSVQ